MVNKYIIASIFTIPCIFIIECSDSPTDYCTLTLCPSASSDNGTYDDKCDSRNCPADLNSCAENDDCVVVDGYCCVDGVIRHPWYINRSYLSMVKEWRNYECHDGPEKDSFINISDCGYDCGEDCRQVLCVDGKCKPGHYYGPNDAGLDVGIN